LVYYGLRVFFNSNIKTNNKMAAFNKEYNTTEVYGILSTNGRKIPFASKAQDYIDFCRVDKDMYVVTKTSSGVEVFELNLDLRDIGGKTRIWAVVGLFPLVNGKPDYDNQLVLNYK
jgi:hypothetical protein